ncbi:MAG: ABC transporter permease [Pseudomonadota bacterium]
MLRFVFGRARNAAVLLVLASMLCFGLVVSAPGNVAVLVAELRTPGATFAQIAVIEEELGLNDPLPIRYANWLSGVTEGDFGISYKTGADVGDAMAGRLSVTATLLAGAAGFAVLLSLGLGFLGALRPYGVVDTLTRAVALVGASTPTFFLGAMLIYGFALSLGWFPTFGFGDGLRSWILPWISLGMLPGCVLSRIVRVGLEEEMTRPFALTARAKGLTRNVILFRDALPNIAPAYLNALGAQATAMTVGSVVIEPLFAWPGVGALFLQGVQFRDFMVVQAGLLIFISFFILLNLAVDIAVMFLDPKLRRQGGH